MTLDWNNTPRAIKSQKTEAVKDAGGVFEWCSLSNGESIKQAERSFVCFIDSQLRGKVSLQQTTRGAARPPLFS